MAMVCFLRQNNTVNAQAGANASHFQCTEQAALPVSYRKEAKTYAPELRSAKMLANAAEQVDAAIKAAKKPAIE
ncbi:hypothetical protein ELG97_11115 [Rhizobium leguminosarum]|nr:hypothetical protein [Rhizobium leguminosarum]MBY5919342.1 hypothetical protein [Rhizobium leguminosarum]RWX25278.1 hypothetical protein EHH54_36075 [Rhizobium leguminosarum]TBE54819.1 hypothetical protein ELH04_10600 [Rhizobium leguminosarum]TBE92398.1 hypothetical protein ELG97_11115 [Rhizobium leguminosarum]TBZ68743.1 hypothetical protein E0H64_15820 [Rhizobium leguminosarum bv. viciae]